jgi:hypothetical protein
MTFRDKLNESANSTLVEVENKLLTLNPAKFVKDAIVAMKDSWYWANRPALTMYSDQNNIASSYTKGSLYDVFRNYRYDSNMSSKVKALIDEKIPVKSTADWSPVSKEWKFEDNGTQYTFKIDIKYDRIIKKIESAPEKVLALIEDPEILGSLTINGKKVAWGTYRTRDMVSPSVAISKKDLLTMLNVPVKEYNDSVTYAKKLREAITLVLINEVIKDYIVDTTKMDDKIKEELSNAKKLDIYKSILKKYEFEGIPASDDVLDGLMKSNDFSYTISGPDGYGHTSGTTYSIKFTTRKVSSESWSSAD